MVVALALMQFGVILCATSAFAYPVYGTKRYGRTTPRRVASSSTWNPYQQILRAQRYPMNYYELYPYSAYPDDYYYAQDSYPVYYPARTSKYEVYQAVLPYYYQDRPSARQAYGYYGYSDEDRLEQLLQEAEREEREDSQPIGQEMLYENDGDSDENIDEVNAAFLQNLIMSQMYKEALDKQKDIYEPDQDYYSNEDVTYGKIEESPSSTKNYRQEDEDVRELKQLAQMKSSGRKQSTDDIHWLQSRKFKNNNWDKRSAPVKTEGAPQTTPGVISTTGAPTTSAAKSNGQKEEVLARPATPVRRPFVKTEQERKRTPSVYDTIKHMLDMEKNMENKYDAEEPKPHMRKRIVSSEESLTQQLSVLKKGQ